MISSSLKAKRLIALNVHIVIRLTWFDKNINYKTNRNDIDFEKKCRVKDHLNEVI